MRIHGRALAHLAQVHEEQAERLRRLATFRNGPAYTLLSALPPDLFRRAAIRRCRANRIAILVSEVSHA